MIKHETDEAQAVEILDVNRLIKKRASSKDLKLYNTRDDDEAENIEISNLISNLPWEVVIDNSTINLQDSNPNNVHSLNSDGPQIQILSDMHTLQSDGLSSLNTNNEHNPILDGPLPNNQLDEPTSSTNRPLAENQTVHLDNNFSGHCFESSRQRETQARPTIFIPQSNNNAHLITFQPPRIILIPPPRRKEPQIQQVEIRPNPSKILDENAIEVSQPNYVPFSHRSLSQHSPE